MTGEYWCASCWDTNGDNVGIANCIRCASGTNKDLSYCTKCAPGTYLSKIGICPHTTDCSTTCVKACETAPVLFL